jgi:hypothetical protein
MSIDLHIKAKLQIITLLFLCVGQIAYHQKAQAQPEVQNVFRIGMEFADFARSESGSFPKQRGMTVGYLTGIRLQHDSSNAILLGIEFNYASMYAYRTHLLTKYGTYTGTYQDTYDESHALNHLELGLSFEPCTSINKDMTIGFYVGGSIGAGFEGIQTHIVSHVLLDSTHWSGSGPEPATGDFFTPISFQSGVNYYYKRLMADLRYKLIFRRPLKDSMTGGSIKENDPTSNVYFQIGFVLF